MTVLLFISKILFTMTYDLTAFLKLVVIKLNLKFEDNCLRLASCK